MMNALSNAKIGAAALLLAGAWAQPYRLVLISGDSMSPTYHNESLHLASRAKEPLYHGEVVVANTPIGTVIKRIALMGGDFVPQMKTMDGWVDLTNIAVTHLASRYHEMRRLQLAPDQVYLLGDHRIGSVDSRTFGPISTSDIVAVLIDQEALRRDPLKGPSLTNLARLRQPNEKSMGSGLRASSNPACPFGSPHPSVAKASA